MKIGFVHVLFVALVSFLTVFLAVWAGEEAFLKSHPANSPVPAPAPPSEEPKFGSTVETGIFVRASAFERGGHTTTSLFTDQP